MKSPFTHGMEIEQFPNQVSSDVANDVLYADNWHRDPSGPQETEYGPYKNVKTIFNRFKSDCNGHTWNWHGSDGSSGAGSHVHLCLTDKFDDELEAWTISYNTAVEIFPFLAPMFCHNWDDGFRDGTNYSGSRTNIDRWASPQLTRFSPSTVEDRVANPNSFRREYSAVTFNPAMGGKPLTIELRANDAHPAFALVGLLFLRRLTNRCVEGGWSPKLENHRSTLNDVYGKIYGRASEIGLIPAMKEDLDITFQDGRGIPGIEQTSFSSVWDVFTSILGTMGTDTGNYKDRAKKFCQEAEEHGYSPSDLTDELWTIDEDGDEFWTQFE